MSLYAAIYPLHQLNLNILNVKKRSDRFLKLEIIKKILFIPVIAVGFFFELQYMIWAAVVYYYVEFFINGWYSHALTGYGTRQQVKDLCPLYLVSISISVAVWLLTLTNLPFLPMMLLQVMVAVVLYVVVYSMMGLPEYMEIKAVCLNKMMRR